MADSDAPARSRGAGARSRIERFEEYNHDALGTSLGEVVVQRETRDPADDDADGHRAIHVTDDGGSSPERLRPGALRIAIALPAMRGATSRPGARFHDTKLGGGRA